ncbi:MAG: VWA domain-containing protein [Acidobacteria bacterium]|nr:VWA domain-containing protein [Acidobacteriota bacterium]
MGRKVHRLICCVLVMAAVVAGVAAQDAGEPMATFFAPLEVPLVSVDVYVSDRDGRPVPGLTIEDFELVEDGDSVMISHFYAAPGVASPDQDSGEVVDSGLTPSPSQDLYLVIFFDDTNLGRGRRQAAVEHLRTFLAGDLPQDLKVMLVRYDGRIHVDRGFTEETDEVITALEAIKDAASLSREIDEKMLIREIETSVTGASVAGRTSPHDLERAGRSSYQAINSYVDQTVHRSRTSIENQKRLIRSLSGLNGRKALLLVSDGVEARPGEGLYRRWAQIFGDISIFRIDAQRAFLQASRNDVSNEFDELAQFANGHRVSIYTLAGVGAGLARSMSAETRLMDVDGVGVDQAMSAEVLMSNMSGTTGGRALVNSPALAGQLADVSVELSSYYSLAFEPNHASDNAYHRLEVKVKRDGVRVRNREGYLDIPQTERLIDATLAAAVHGVADNPLGIAASSGQVMVREDGSYLVPIIVTVPIGGLVLVPSEEEHRGQISILFTVRDDRGDLSPPQRREYPVPVGNDDLASALSQTAGFTFRLAVRPGRQRIAVGVRDEIAQTESVTMIEVDVKERVHAES